MRGMLVELADFCLTGFGVAGFGKGAKGVRVLGTDALACVVDQIDDA